MRQQEVTSGIDNDGLPFGLLRKILLSRIYLESRNDPPKIGENRRWIFSDSQIAQCHFELSDGMLVALIKEYAVHIRRLPERNAWFVFIDRWDSPSVHSKEIAHA